MLLIAKFIVALSGFWLIAVSVFMIYRPGAALNALWKMASTNLINYTEITLRMMVGIAFIFVARELRLSFIFNFVGWFLAISAGVLYAVPRQWHHNYARYWARKLTPFYVRALAPFSIAAGIWVLKTIA